ncbi:glycoside hydrolase family 3 protein [Aquiflexum sp. TKW24L]|uniref:glycoside hydrolase family 3 protein n=1 Tax=Aquiflexum sp. TKW24L TaxID=2942212 RepID=UPI0020C017B2|nr:glycoside hydrolase family 3 protein [Aquiflexum sp. TKW24L]MCL6259128.1 glycoside hydrolase family 3 protein [Aquiflexum sp. TKW24L]
MTLKEKIGQLFSPAAFIHDTEENYIDIESLIKNQHIGGLTFFHSRHSAAANFEKRQEKLTYENTLEKLRALIVRYQSISKQPLLMSIDAEFGLAMRIENTPQYPYAITLGALSLEQEDLVFETGYRMGKDLKQTGIHLNFAPVADINTNPKNPVIGYRSFGPNKEKVSRFALAMYRGLEKAGIGACYKHFPGHGDTDTDSHLGLPVINKTKEELIDEELYPFTNGIQAGIDMIMVGHLAAPSLSNGKNIPASISKEIITDFLKGEMGFKGIVVSDALNMKSVSDLFPEPGQLEWEAFNAGNDFLCFSENVKEGIEMILKNGSEEKILESFQKVTQFKEKLGIYSDHLPKEIGFDWSGNHAFNHKLSIHYITEISNQNPQNSLDLSDSKFAKVSLFQGKENVFFSELDKAFSSESLDLISSTGQNWERINDFESLLIAIFVPSAKPVNHFGIDMDMVKKLNTLIESKNCILYLFGSPLSLNEIGSQEIFDKITCAFQNFVSAQKAAALHFLGKIEAEGRLD